MNQKVNLVNSILFPNGYENLMLAVYFVIVPYVAGLLFIFFYIAKGDYTVLLTLNDDNSFLITWAIGYEVVAALLLLWITKLALFSYLRSKSGNNHRNNFRIP